MHVRFTAKADTGTQQKYVRFVPKADIVKNLQESTAGLRLKVVKKTATRRVKQSCDYLVQSHGLPISRTVGGCRFCSGLLCNVGRKAMSKIIEGQHWESGWQRLPRP